MAHRDAVGHGDGDEFARRATGRDNALLDDASLAHQRNIAGRGFIPAGGHANERLMDLLFRQAHRVEIGPMRSARRPLGHMTAWEIFLIENARIHTLKPASIDHVE